MRPRASRLRRPEWLVGAGGIVLLGSMLLLPWYHLAPGPGGHLGHQIGGWNGLSHARWLLVVTIVLALAAAFRNAQRRPSAFANTLSLLVALLAGLTTSWLILRVLISPPGGREVGGWIGLLATLAIVYGGFASVRREGIHPAGRSAEIPETTDRTMLRSGVRRVRAWWPPGAAGWVLVGLVVLGLALRILAGVGAWPTLPNLADAYQVAAGSNPFLDPQHPAGYPLIIAVVGAVTRQVAVLILLQHLLGVASALILFAATRRATGSAWAGLLPAGMLLLGGDHVFLEHHVMSESWEVLACSAGMYAAVRSFDAPSPWWRWPLLTGVILGIAGVIRSAALVLFPVAIVALLVAGPPDGARWSRVRAPMTVAGAAIVILLLFAGANARFGPGFEISPSPGWYLYGDVAQFADCHKFTPPAGTKFLCQARPAAQRPGYFYYLFDPRSPALRHFGRIGAQDGLVGAWARRALFAQFGDYLATAWTYLRSYWIPGLLPSHLRGSSISLSQQLDFTMTTPLILVLIQRQLELYFEPFRVHLHRPVLQFLHDWQQVFRFGATLLCITTALTLVGLVLGSRRSRAAIVLFGLGALALLIAPALVGNETGRFTVPMAGPLMAAAAVALLETWRRVDWAAGRRVSFGQRSQSAL